MSKVGIISTGQTKFSKEDADVEKLLYESANYCIQSASDVDCKDIDGVIVSTNDNS